MKSRRMFLGLLGVAAALLSAFLPTRPVRNLACIGDSLTNGFAFEFYCHLLAKDRTGQDFGSMNFGVGTQTCADMLTRSANEIDGKGFTHKIIACGTNDCAGNIPAATIKSNITTMALGAASNHMVPITLTIPPRGGGPGYGPGQQACLDDVNNFITGTGAGTLRALVPTARPVDTRSYLWNPLDHFALDPLIDLGDHLHYTQTGHRRVADVVNAATVLDD